MPDMCCGRRADRARITVFGTSAKYLDALQKAGLRPMRRPTICRRCGRSSRPARRWSPESFDYVYERHQRDVQLASISGGTDIVSCFALGNPALPVYPGEMQCRGLGMAVEVFNDAG
jgi:acetoacetyl-CoA synthetase